jgi:argininosuccinate lyase
MTYNRDMQEDKEPVFDSIDTIKAALEVVAAMFGGIEVNGANCAAAVGDANLMATDLADYLVKKGVPFRKAHEAVGKSVALCAEKMTDLRGLTIADYRSLSAKFDADVFDMLDAAKSLAARQAIGAPSPENVAAQLKKWRAIL